MGLLYDFTDLISKYSVEGRLIQESSKGEYIGGNWISAPADEPKPVKGAFLPMTRQKVYQSGGAYTENDRELITLEEIPLEPSAYVVFQGMKYKVESESDYSLYAGFHSYNLKRVGTFDRAKTD